MISTATPLSQRRSIHRSGGGGFPKGGAEPSSKCRCIDALKYLTIAALSVMGTLWYQRLSMNATALTEHHHQHHDLEATAERGASKLSTLRDFNAPPPPPSSTMLVQSTSSISTDHNPPPAITTPAATTAAAGTDHVYLDWEYSSDLFSNNNYRSIESALRVYRDNKFTFSVIGSEFIRTYKLGDSMSITTFDKFRKQGYAFQSVVYTNFSHENFVIRSPSLRSYWNTAHAACCSRTRWIGRTQDNFHIEVPFHMHMFMQMQQLVKTGGIYTDFSWFHTNVIPETVTNGYVIIIDEKMSAFSPDLKQRETTIIDKKTFKSTKAVLAPHSHARTSILMVFRDSERAVPKCVLGHYAKASENCIGNTTVIHPEMADFVYGRDHWTAQEKKEASVRPPSPIDLAARKCIVKILEYCFKVSNLSNQLAEYSANTNASKRTRTIASQLSSSTSHVRSSAAIVTFGGDDRYATSVLQGPGHSTSLTPLATTIIDKAPVSDSSSSRNMSSDPVFAAVWMGFQEAYSGLWQTARPGTIRQLINVHVDSTYTMRNKVANFIVAQSRTHQCSGGLLSLRASSRNYTAYPSFSLKYLKGGQVRDVARVPMSVRVRSYMSTAPTFFIPGFMKAGTTFLHETLAKHPQVLMNTAGSGFKETGCYMPAYLREHIVHERMNCFPFVRANEGFIYGDGTVIYANFLELPRFMYAENPALKIIFMVREPIDLLHSQFRFMYVTLASKGESNLNEHIKSILVDNVRANQMQEFRDIAVALLAAKDSATERRLQDRLVEKFYVLMSPRNSMPMNMLLMLIHYPAIQRWVSIFGRAQVMVIPSESLRLPPDLSTNVTTQDSVRRIWNDIYSFLGICPFDELPEREIHATNKNIIPEQYTITDATIEIVSDFMRPFNALMYKYLNVQY